MLARGSRKAARELQKWYVCLSLHVYGKSSYSERNESQALAILDQPYAIADCFVHIAYEAGQASLGLSRALPGALG